MRKFVEEDFDALQFPVHRHPVESFSIFSAHKEFLLMPPDMIRYINFAFDANSPFVKECDTVEERRVLAAHKAGLFTKESGITEDVEEIIRSMNIQVNMAAIRFCMLSGDVDMMAMFSYETALYEELGKLAGTKKELDYDKRKDIIANAEKLRELVTNLKVTLLHGRDKMLERDLQAMLDAPELGLSPEEYAAMLGGGMV